MNFFIVFVNFDFDPRIANFAFDLTNAAEVLEFTDCICRVGDQLSEKNFMVAVKELFDQWKDVLYRYINFTICYFYIFLFE